MVETESVINVEKLLEPMRATHKSRVNLSYDWRRKQLITLRRMMKENTNKLRAAMSLDLGRDPCEAICCETKPVERDLDYVLKHLQEWMRPVPVASPVVMAPAWSYIRRSPLSEPGVLVIGPFNYPLAMLLRPLVGILAGGNPAVLKPSELTPNVGQLLKVLCDDYFQPGAVQVVLGGIPETTALLQQQWGKVMFMGSGRVGKLVAQACASTGTPTLLELGGKCPLVVDESVPTSKLQNAADRIIFAKLMNSGQTCVAPDTLLVHEMHLRPLLSCLVASIEAQFGNDPKTGELGSMVNQAQAERVIQLIQDTENATECCSQVVYGGSRLCDVENRYICPTIIRISLSEKGKGKTPPRILKDEIFGPVLPIVTFSDRKWAYEFINNVLPGTPLQLYVFTPSTAVFEEYVKTCVSSAAIQNDAMVQGASSHLPLGGLGTSGHGCYYGRFSFEAFTHIFPVAHRPLGSVWDLNNLRCHPYAGAKARFLENVAMEFPDIPVIGTRRLLLAFAIVGDLFLDQ